MVNVFDYTKNVVALVIVLAVSILVIVIFVLPNINGVMGWISGVLKGWFR